MTKLNKKKMTKLNKKKGLIEGVDYKIKKFGFIEIIIGINDCAGYSAFRIV